MKKPHVPATYKFNEPPHIMIVEARYYDDVSDMMLQGSMDVMKRVGATCEVFTVPGALEIPSAILYAVKGLDFDPVRRRFDGYVALGCVLKGGTRHDEIVATECVRGLQRLALDRTLAIGNGILTCDKHEQALERADPARQNRGGAAAEACLRMVELKQNFRLSPKRRWIAR